MLVFIIAALTSVACTKSEEVNLDLRGDWGVVETALFVNDSLTSSLQLNEINTHYSFSQDMNEVEIINDGISERYDCVYNAQDLELIIGMNMTYEIEWITPDAVYFHRHYGVNHSRYKLLLE